MAAKGLARETKSGRRDMPKLKESMSSGRFQNRKKQDEHRSKQGMSQKDLLRKEMMDQLDSQIPQYFPSFMVSKEIAHNYRNILLYNQGYKQLKLDSMYTKLKLTGNSSMT